MMNEDPVIINVDVDMDIVVLDEDDENTNSSKTVGVPSAPIVETIDLDDDTPIITGAPTLVNNPTTSDKAAEISFRNYLENNRLMDKIVTTCINMENAMGMPRVVYKTLLPLYRDTNNRFKESDAFRALLKKTYKLLMRDPDHKFLHIKTLCEELKSGGLRRKVPFVTLATNLKNTPSQWNREAFTSSSREINHNNLVVRPVRKVYRNTRKKVCPTAPKRKVKRAKKQIKPVKDRIKTRSVTNAEKEITDIIELDDSETESATSTGSVSEAPNQKQCEAQNDVIVIEETEPSDQRNDNINTDTQTVQETLEEDSNKENNDNNINGKSSENELDYELLIPTNICNVIVEDQPVEREVSVVPDANAINIEIARLEKQIECDKRMVDQLEEAEVLSEYPQASPYYLCSKYKENIVYCYKRICELKGDCESLVKRNEIRLRVAKGHPSGPAERLQDFLNSTIDETGTVQFPDLSDVVQCVIDSNFTDNLGWNGPQIIQEAVALFRQCGQALRKRRQKREYKDLLSLIPDEATDDPAEKDPVLLAKLEENKLIAKIKEEEILNRYVNMEQNRSLTKFVTPHVTATAEFESDKDSSDSESEENLATPNNISNFTVTNLPETGESSRNNINLSLLQTNNTIVTSSNNCVSDTTNSSNTTATDVNNFVVTSTAPPTTLKPMLMNVVFLPPPPPLFFIQNTVGNEDQFEIRECTIMNAPNNNTVMFPTIITNPTTDTVYNAHETLTCSDKEKRMNSEVNTTVSNAGVRSNTETINGNSDRCSLNATNTRNEEREFNPFNDTNVHNNVSTTTGGVEQNCDSSINSAEVQMGDTVKREPLDIQSMLDQLEDGFVCQVFDIEDPFLVIEISSDGFTDDEL